MVHHLNEVVGKPAFKASWVDNAFTVQHMVDSAAKHRLPPVDLPPPPPVDIVHLKIARNGVRFDELLAALRSASVLVLEQADHAVFNHGAPIDSDEKDAMANYMDNYVALSHAFSQSTCVVVAAIDGEVRAGGMLFPAMADICLCTAVATFGLPEIHQGMVPSVVSKALVERLGTAVSRRLSLTGAPFDAARALALGLVDTVYATTKDMAREIENMVRRWKTVPRATRFIKTNLVPRKANTFLDMGTVAGGTQPRGRTHRTAGDDRPPQSRDHHHVRHHVSEYVYLRNDEAASRTPAPSPARG